jgi:hypothetical protein
VRDLHTEPTVALVLPAEALARRAGEARPAEDVPAFVDALPPPVRRLWDGPGIFPAAFAVGFLLSLSLGAAVLWRGPDLAELLQAGRADDVLAALPSSDLSPEQRLWQGHALHAKGEREATLRAYQQALAGGSVDERALQNTLEALGHARSRSLAVATLVEWRDADVDDLLVGLASDPGYERRHGALDALRARSTADAARRVRAAVLVAVTDARSDVCAEKAEGVAALAGFVDVPAAQASLRELKAWDAVLALNNESIFALNPCLDRGLVKKTDTALGAAQRR